MCFVQCVPNFTTENSVLKNAYAIEPTVRVVMLSQENVTVMRVGQDVTVHRTWTNVRLVIGPVTRAPIRPVSTKWGPLIVNVFMEVLTPPTVLVRIHVPGIEQ